MSKIDFETKTTFAIPQVSPMRNAGTATPTPTNMKGARELAKMCAKNPDVLEEVMLRLILQSEHIT